MNPGLMSAFGASSVGGRRISRIINRYSSGGYVPDANLSVAPNAKTYASSSVAANELQTMLRITGRGVLNFVSAYTGNTTSRTVRIKVTIDGVVIFDATSAAVTSVSYGMVAVGSYPSNSVPALTFQPIRFYGSCVVEIASSVLNDSTYITTAINYEVDQ